MVYIFFYFIVMDDWLFQILALEGERTFGVRIDSLRTFLVNSREKLEGAAKGKEFDKLKDSYMGTEQTPGIILYTVSCFYILCLLQVI